MVDIAQGGGGDVKYSVKFEGGKLVAVESAEKYGLKNTTELDGRIVIDAVIDLLEGVVPGDQKAIAEMVKTYAHQALDAQK